MSIYKWFRRQIWWRKYYKKVSLSETDSWRGRCVFCDAGTQKNDIPRCSAKDNRECPCEWGQCLVRKKIRYESK